MPPLRWQEWRMASLCCIDRAGSKGSEINWHHAKFSAPSPLDGHSRSMCRLYEKTGNNTNKNSMKRNCKVRESTLGHSRSICIRENKEVIWTRMRWKGIVKWINEHCAFRLVLALMQNQCSTWIFTKKHKNYFVSLAMPDAWKSADTMLATNKSHQF